MDSVHKILSRNYGVPAKKVALTIKPIAQSKKTNVISPTSQTSNNNVKITKATRSAS